MNEGQAKSVRSPQGMGWDIGEMPVIPIHAYIQGKTYKLEVEAEQSHDNVKDVWHIRASINHGQRQWVLDRIMQTEMIDRLIHSAA